MSIYATWLLFDEDGDSPFEYQGSHVRPSEHGPRGGWLDVAAIPNHVAATDETDDGPLVDFLRFGLGTPDGGDATVLLNRLQVESLHRILGEWLTAEVRW